MFSLMLGGVLATLCGIFADGENKKGRNAVVLWIACMGFVLLGFVGCVAENALRQADSRPVNTTDYILEHGLPGPDGEAPGEPYKNPR